jgi:hypothetical protein
MWTHVFWATSEFRAGTVNSVPFHTGTELRMLDQKALLLGRECAHEWLQPFVESLVVFLTAQNVIAAYGRAAV